MDTGASGLVMTPRAATKLGLESFGELWVAGVGGSVQCQYRRAHTLTLGPLTIERCAPLTSHPPPVH